MTSNKEGSNEWIMLDVNDCTSRVVACDASPPCCCTYAARCRHPVPDCRNINIAAVVLLFTITRTRYHHKRHLPTTFLHLPPRTLFALTPLPLPTRCHAVPPHTHYTLRTETPAPAFYHLPSLSRFALALPPLTALQPPPAPGCPPATCTHACLLLPRTACYTPYACR